MEVWLPRDRSMVNHIVEVYFTRLNPHRPVFSRREFERLLKNVYDNDQSVHDPGFMMSLYLVMALGTLSELNHRFGASVAQQDPSHYGGALGFASKTLMPPEWPDYDEFFERALGVKPDLRVTVSSLQALILLHWYLYTEVGFLTFLSSSMSLINPPHSAKAAASGASSAASSASQSNSVSTTTPPRK